MKLSVIKTVAVMSRIANSCVEQAVIAIIIGVSDNCEVECDQKSCDYEQNSE